MYVYVKDLNNLNDVEVVNTKIQTFGDYMYCKGTGYITEILRDESPWKIMKYAKGICIEELQYSIMKTVIFPYRHCVFTEDISIVETYSLMGKINETIVYGYMYDTFTIQNNSELKFIRNNKDNTKEITKQYLNREYTGSIDRTEFQSDILFNLSIEYPNVLDICKKIHDDYNSVLDGTENMLQYGLDIMDAYTRKYG